jgi:hypothetical protein
MKIKLNQELLDAEGKSIPAGLNKPKLYLKDVCISSLLAPIQGDEEKVKLDKYDIYKKFRDAKQEVELMAEEIATTKKAIGKLQAPLIMGQAFEMIEGK